MGTINYFTSDYITLGVDVDKIRRVVNLDATIDEDPESFFDFEIEFLRDIVTEILGKYDFYYYHISVKPGYYEGFSIDIENNFGVFYEDYADKQEAQKEITQIKKFLFELCDAGLVSVFPGWCTTYRSEAETRRDIVEAIKAMREEAKETPTYNKYCA